MSSEITEFYNQILEDKEGHRYRSWEHCFKAFVNPELSIDNLSLHIAFYLASWGMYRGSSGLLWKDYKVHVNAVEIIKKFKDVRVHSNQLYPDIQDTFNCFAELKTYYSNINYFNNKERKKISATNTLLTKIMLGYSGAVPAFDRYFIFGSSRVLNIHSSCKKNITILYEYATDHHQEIESFQSFIMDKTGFWYPPMKILDMYFWQIGFNNDQKPII